MSLLKRSVLLFFAAVGCSGQIKVDAVLNAASGTASLAPGTWAALYGSNLAPAAVAANAVPFAGTLGGVQVTVGGRPAPLSYVSPGQINLLIPFEAASLIPGQQVIVPLIVVNASGTGAPFNLALNYSAPAIFTKNLAGSGPALAFDPLFRDITSVTGGPVVIYATGLGPTNPAAGSSSTGAATEPLNRVLSAVTVMLGDVKIAPSFAGLAPFLQRNLPDQLHAASRRFNQPFRSGRHYLQQSFHSCDLTGNEC
jgi:uncharacterized protein (TIGR03437 family)